MLEIETFVVTPFAQNARVLLDGETAVVIDPGGESEKIWRFIQDRGVRLTEIWLTHSHVDHCGGVAALKEKSEAILVAHSNEEFLRSNVDKICAMYGLPQGDMSNCPEPDVCIVGGEQLQIGSNLFEVLFTPGHSPGHVSFFAPSLGIIFSGDVLFQGSIGRTDLPGGDHQTLLTSIKEKLLVLPEKTVVYCGHGPNTTIEIERENNPFL
ncbi:MAG: MBL fold metallo-hydrolase [Bdellovibrionales bacterium]|nr:MBL fold metallo-hydrolase [Bdellovibrionales bacterium]